MAQQEQQLDIVKVGDIFVSTWGYDMVIVDFYEVTAMSASGKTVTVRKIGGAITEGEPLSPQGANVVPAPHDFIGEPFRRRLRYDGSAPSFRVNDCSHAYLATEHELTHGVYECEWD